MMIKEYNRQCRRKRLTSTKGLIWVGCWTSTSWFYVWFRNGSEFVYHTVWISAKKTFVCEMGFQFHMNSRSAKVWWRCIDAQNSSTPDIIHHVKCAWIWPITCLCQWASVFFIHPAFIYCLLNSSPPSAAYRCQWIMSALIQIMACRLFGAKPLPKPTLGYCQLEPYEQTSVTCLSKYKNFNSRKCFWKCCRRNGGHFVQGR